MKTVELIKRPKNYLITSVYNPRSARTSPDAVYQKLLMKAAEHPKSLNYDEWKFMAKELPHLRTAYGVYLSIGRENRKNYYVENILYAMQRATHSKS